MRKKSVFTDDMGIMELKSVNFRKDSSLLQNKLHSPVNNFTFNHETNFHDPITIFLEKTAKTGAFLA